MPLKHSGPGVEMGIAEAWGCVRSGCHGEPQGRPTVLSLEGVVELAPWCSEQGSGWSELSVW